MDDFATPLSPGKEPGEEEASPSCRNCGAPLTGPFCAQCGQKRRPRVVPLRQLAEEAVGSLFSFDTRLWRTVGPFLFRPGMLVNEYLAGRRRRYVPPLRLYIFLSFAFFLFLSLSGAGGTFQEGFEGGFLEGDDAHPADTSAAPRDTASVASPPAVTSPGGERAMTTEEQMLRVWSQRTPVIFFFAVPLLALVFKLLYWRSGLYYVQHLIVALHAQAFGFAAFGIVILLGETLEALLSVVWSEAWVVTLLLLTLAVYLLLMVRRVYGQPWWKSAIKTVLMFACYLPVTLGAAFLIFGAVNLLFG